MVILHSLASWTSHNIPPLATYNFICLLKRAFLSLLPILLLLSNFPPRCLYLLSFHPGKFTLNVILIYFECYSMSYAVGFLLLKLFCWLMYFKLYMYYWLKIYGFFLVLFLFFPVARAINVIMCLPLSCIIQICLAAEIIQSICQILVLFAVEMTAPKESLLYCSIWTSFSVRKRHCWYLFCSREYRALGKESIIYNCLACKLQIKVMIFFLIDMKNSSNSYWNGWSLHCTCFILFCFYTL